MILYNYVPFQNGNFSLRKEFAPKGANSFLLEQILKVWKITFTTLGELPWKLLFSLRTRVYCIMGDTLMLFTQLILAKNTPEDIHVKCDYFVSQRNNGGSRVGSGGSLEPTRSLTHVFEYPMKLK